MKTVALTIFIVLMSLTAALPVFAEPIRIGVSVTLSGEAASFGTDMKNAIQLAAEEIDVGRYKLIYEDEKCGGREAVSVAHKFISVHRVAYAIGFSCNQTLLSAAPVYQKAGVIVISGMGTTGDVTGIGDKVFRLFPADHAAVDVLYPYIASRHERLGIITEESEYPELMRRTFVSRSRQTNSLELLQENYRTGDNDLRQVLLRLKGKKADALFLNPLAESGFIRLVKQLEEVKFHPDLYTVYWPTAQSVQQAVAPSIDGIVFANLPDEKSLPPSGQLLLDRFRKRFGEPLSAPFGVAYSYEALRLLDEAIRSGRPVQEYLKAASVVNGVIGPYSFDNDGAVRGISFELQTLKNGAIVAVREDSP